MLSWLVVDLLILLLNDWGYKRGRAVTIEVHPWAIWVLVALHFLLSEQLYVLGWTRLRRELILVDPDVLKPLIVVEIGKGLLNDIVWVQRCLLLTSESREARFSMHVLPAATLGILLTCTRALNRLISSSIAATSSLSRSHSSRTILGGPASTRSDHLHGTLIG